MSQLNEAIARYHKILESDQFRDLAWAKDLQERMEADRLSSGGRLLCPFLRPNFVTQRQYDALVRAGEALLSANYRMQGIALASPRLLAKLELLPAERMLAAIDPGYTIPEVSSHLDLQFQNGSLQVAQYSGDVPHGSAYTETLAEMFLRTPLMAEFRRKYNLTSVGGNQPLVAAIAEAYNQFSAARAHSSNGNGYHANGNGNGHGPKLPSVALMEFRQTGRASELGRVRDAFRSAGFHAEIIAPDQLEYKGVKLRSGAFEIDLVYRHFTVQEFVQRFDLTHPLLRAYRDRKVCVVNSFRSEMTRKRAMLALLSDPAITAKFPPAERRAIRDHVPWTRLFTAGKTTHGEDEIELMDWVRDHRADLALKPSDAASDAPVMVGSDMDAAGWERAMRQAQRAPYVVQEIGKRDRLLFPLISYGHLEFREMTVDMHPQAFLGKVSGLSSWLNAASGFGFSTSAGLAPTFIIDSKS